jgi:hypothetical protein
MFHEGCLRPGQDQIVPNLCLDHSLEQGNALVESIHAEARPWGREMAMGEERGE